MGMRLTVNKRKIGSSPIILKMRELVKRRYKTKRIKKWNKSLLRE